MGKKYIIDLEDSESVYKTIITNGYPMLQVIVPAPYTEPDLEQVKKEAYQQGYEQGYKDGYNEPGKNQQEAYQRGMDDANRDGEYNADDGWYVMQKISLLPNPIKTELFGTAETAVILQDNSFKDALVKLTEYEQEKERQIQIGDEVIPRETEYDTMIVTRLWKDDYDSDCIDAIGFDGRIGSFLVSRVSKTGKHYEIAEVLRKMKENSDG